MKSSIALAKRLKALMKEKNISATDISKNCKLSLSAVYNILNARNDTGTYSIFQFAKALNVPIVEIFNDDLLTLDNLDDTRKK